MSIHSLETNVLDSKTYVVNQCLCTLYCHCIFNHRQNYSLNSIKVKSLSYDNKSDVVRAVEFRNMVDTLTEFSVRNILTMLLNFVVGKIFSLYEQCFVDQ